MAQDEQPLLNGQWDPRPEGCGFFKCLGISLLQLLISLFNFSFLIVGGLITIVGIAIHNKLAEYFELVGPDGSQTYSVVIIAWGLVCCVVAVMLHMGSKYENTPTLACSTVFLLGIFIVMIIAGAGSLINKHKFEDMFKKGFEKTITSAGWDENGNRNQSMAIISVIQEKLGCCGGVNGYQDWQLLNPGFDSHQVPVSCCKNDICGSVENGVVQLKESEQDISKVIYENGCYKSVADYVQDNNWALIVAAFGMSMLTLVGLVLSTCLCCAVRKSGGRYNYSVQS